MLKVLLSFKISSHFKKQRYVCYDFRVTCLCNFPLILLSTETEYGSFLVFTKRKMICSKCFSLKFHSFYFIYFEVEYVNANIYQSIAKCQVCLVQLFTVHHLSPSYFLDILGHIDLQLSNFLNMKQARNFDYTEMKSSYEYYQRDWKPLLQSRLKTHYFGITKRASSIKFHHLLVHCLMEVSLSSKNSCLLAVSSSMTFYL